MTSTVVSTSYPAADGSELIAQIARPTESGAGRRPAIVLFHGGSWRSARKGQTFEELSRFLASRGMVAVSGTYRGTNSGAGSIDDCVADVRATLQWVREMPGVDASRIVVGGHSAGGHLALCAALRADADGWAPAAAIVLSPAVGVMFPAHLAPMELVAAGAPPTLILQGARDSMTPPPPARRFAQRMVAAGNDCRLELVDGAHTFYAFREQTYVGFRHALRSIDGFLVELGHISPLMDVEAAIDRLGPPPRPRPRRP